MHTCGVAEVFNNLAYKNYSRVCRSPPVIEKYSTYMRNNASYFIRCRLRQRSRQQRKQRPQATSQSHDVFGRPTREAGAIFRTDSLPRCLRARGDRSAHRSLRITRASLVQQPTRALAQADQQRTTSVDVHSTPCSRRCASVVDERQCCVSSRAQPSHSKHWCHCCPVPSLPLPSSPRLRAASGSSSDPANPH